MRPYSLVSGDRQWEAAQHDNTQYERMGDVVRLVDLDDDRVCHNQGVEAPKRPEFTAPVGMAAAGVGVVLRYERSPDLTWLVEARRGVNRRWVSADGGLVEGLGRCPAALVTPNGLIYAVDLDAAAIVTVDRAEHVVKPIIPVEGLRDIDLIVGNSSVEIVALSDAPRYLSYIDECGDVRRYPLRRRRCGVPRSARPRRLAAWGGLVVVLWRDRNGRGWLSDASGELLEETEAWPTDVVFEASGRLVVSHERGARFTSYVSDGDGRWSRWRRLTAPGYDGSGLVVVDGRAAYWTASRGGQYGSPMHAVDEPSRYVTDGSVTTPTATPLDAGEYGITWGRVFVDACVPPGTSIELRCATSDDWPEGAAGDGATPGTSAGRRLHAEPWQPMHRRSTGSELPWQVAPQGFATWEAPVLAAPGRFLWLSLRLRGDGSSTPDVRTVRVERPSHELLRHLPKVFSRDTGAADFLRRLLAPAEGMFVELDDLAASRDRLLDPAVTPAEVLPWLAGFVGLVLDERWSEPARRALVANAARLFARRGTVGGLEEFLRLAVDAPVQILEEFRLRGLASRGAPSALGVGRRVGDRLVGEADAALTPTSPERFSSGAHRFIVIVRAPLDETRTEILHTVLDLHRPAHTAYRVCVLTGQSRAGQDLLGISTLIGRRADFAAAVVGSAHLGGAGTIGHPTLPEGVAQRSARIEVEG